MRDDPLRSMVGDTALAEVGDDEIDLLALVGTLWRGKWFIALFGLIAMVLGGYYAYVAAVPIYSASSTVALESRQEQVLNLESVMSGLSGDQAVINTEVEVIRSRILMERLVQSLDLMADPEFNHHLRPEPTFVLSPGWVVGKIVELVVRQAPEQPEPEEQDVLDRVIDAVADKIDVSNVRQSYVFRINVKTEDPRKSALIANTLAEVYISDQLEVKFEATEKASGWLSERVADLESELEAAERAVQEFNTRIDLISPETLQALNVQVKDTRDRLAAVEDTAQAARERVEQLIEARETGSLDDLVALANDPTLTRIFTMMREGVVDDRSSFDARSLQVLERAEVEAARAESQVASLSASLEALNRQIERQSVDLVQLEQLMREAEATRLIYESFLTRLKEISVQQGIQQADSRILSYAVTPRVPSEPRKSMIVAMSLILGVMLGSGAILFREVLHKGIRTADDLERIARTAVLGQVPVIPAKHRDKVLSYLAGKSNSPAAEALRNLRTSVLLSNVDAPPQTIMITSSIPGEGKTTVSLALAQNFSDMGKKVLLVEGDIRRRVFTEYFEIADPRGLLAVLSGAVQPEDVVHHDPRLNADILPSEKSSVSATDVFSSEKFHDFIERAKEAYDVIIIDTPPVLIVPDARVIGQSCDTVLYVVKWDSTSKSQVQDGLRQFGQVNVRVSGLVLSQIDPRGMKRYGYGDRYGAYAAYAKGYYD